MNVHVHALQTHRQRLLRTWLHRNVPPQTQIIALLLTVTIFVPQVYIAHASVALNQTVPVLQEAALKKMCAVYVTETGLLV